MIAPIDKVLDEGNCGRVTDRGEEACEEMRKRRVCMSSPPGSLLVKAARLRTETSYKAGSGMAPANGSTLSALSAHKRDERGRNISRAHKADPAPLS